MAHMWCDRVLWHICLKLSVMQICCTHLHVSVPHVTFSREWNGLDLSLYHRNWRGMYIVHTDGGWYTTLCPCQLPPPLTWGRHVRGASRFDLLHVSETLFAEQLVKVGNDLVQQPEALDALVVSLQLHVELGEVWNGREHYTHRVALLVIELL